MCPQVCDKNVYQRKLSPSGCSASQEPEKLLAFSAPPLRCFTILSRRLFRKTRYVTWWNHHEISLEASNAGCLFSQSDAEKIAKYAHDQFGGRWILESRNIDVQPVIGAF